MDMLTFAIGDVHGCFAKLEALMGECVRYAAGRPFRFVMLGDYIDRGPDSRDVVRRLLELSRERPDRLICLKGNHEDMLGLAAAAPTRHLYQWLANGGGDTLISYGIERVTDFPADDLAWLTSRPLFVDDGRRFFCHAGVDPRLPLDRQDAATLLWTREPYPEALDVGRFIVHGHTPCPDGAPDLQAHRLNLDTGAVFGGPLTAAVFGNEQTAPLAFITDGGRKRTPAQSDIL